MTVQLVNVLAVALAQPALDIYPQKKKILIQEISRTIEAISSRLEQSHNGIFYF